MIPTALLIAIFSMTLSLGVLFFPRDAHAIAVVDAGNIAQSTITATNTTVSSYNSMSLQIKAFVLDTVATTIAKQLIRRITASVVQWINSGFQGSPSFITNPGGFFLDVADQISGEFLAKFGGPLNALCSEFSIDIRLALAFKYHPRNEERYKCTLSTVINNAKNAKLNVSGSATLNGKGQSGGFTLDKNGVTGSGGFVGGDFSQGGWPAFVSLTTEPQNNIYGAYLTADAELSLKVANAQLNKKEELSYGNGFLSWRNPKCTAEVKAHNAQAKANYEADSEEGYMKRVEQGQEGGQQFEVMKNKSVNDCPIETPGSLIVSSLETSANGPLHELELVDSINEIVNALAAQLINTILQGGLSAISGTGPSDSTAYINQVQAESNAQGAQQIQTSKDSLLQNIQIYITNAVEYRTNRVLTLNKITEVKDRYDQAKACYETKKLTYPANTSVFQSQINLINATEANFGLQGLFEKFAGLAADADTKYKTLSDLRDQTNLAKTADELNVPSQKFSLMTQAQNLVTAKDISDARQDLESTSSQTAPMKTDADQKFAQCQAGGTTYELPH